MGFDTTIRVGKELAVITKRIYKAPKNEIKRAELQGFNIEQLAEDVFISAPKTSGIKTFSFGKKTLSVNKQIGDLFIDETTKFCDVSIKDENNICKFFSDYIKLLPSKYVEKINNNLQIKPCIEIDTFEMFQKGNGLGSKKLQEIIKYAQKNMGGRLYLHAVKCGDCNSPVLFYYKNGLRSVDEGINIKLEKILNGILPVSEVPNSSVMYLP